MSYPYEMEVSIPPIVFFIFPSLFFLFLGRYFLIRKKSALVLSLVFISLFFIGTIYLILPEKTIKEGKKNCTVKEDCVVFDKKGCSTCGCYNKNNKPIIIGGWQNVSLCFCFVPTSCECINGKCEGKGNETVF